MPVALTGRAGDSAAPLPPQIGQCDPPEAEGAEPRLWLSALDQQEVTGSASSGCAHSSLEGGRGASGGRGQCGLGGRLQVPGSCRGRVLAVALLGLVVALPTSDLLGRSSCRTCPERAGCCWKPARPAHSPVPACPGLLPLATQGQGLLQLLPKWPTHPTQLPRGRLSLPLPAAAPPGKAASVGRSPWEPGRLAAAGSE